MKKFRLAVLEGDGIGPEITREATKVMDRLSAKFDFDIEYAKAYIGGVAIDKFGEPLPKKTIDICKASDSIILGAVGGPKWDNLDGNSRPEAGLLGIRKNLGLFANLRQCVILDQFSDLSPIKKSNSEKNFDLLIVRELTGGIYFGDRGRGIDNGEEFAYDTEKYSKNEIIRIAKVAFDLAQKRNNVVCSVDKANVLESSRFWRECVTEVAKSYPNVRLTHMYVDNCAMQLINNPSQFDVILTSNIFGDILSDEASMICGSIGLLPSASLSMEGLGLYEPVHGSAPDIQGKNIANPIATMLSCAMMFEFSLNLPEVAQCLKNAINMATQIAVTPDLSNENLRTISCSEMGDLVCSFI